MEILENLDPLLRAFWFIAIPTSLIFTIQTILTFIGIDSFDGVDFEFDSHTSFHPFSLRNLINFLLGFSWTGISFYSTISNRILLVVLALAVGIIFVVLFFLIIKQLQKLTEDNTFKIINTLNKTAEVYLTIPENKKGKGKIMISVNGSFHELEAMTENNTIPSGSTVKVVRIENDNILIVEII